MWGFNLLIGISLIFFAGLNFDTGNWWRVIFELFLGVYCLCDVFKQLQESRKDGN